MEIVLPILFLLLALGGLTIWACTNAERKRRDFWSNLARQWNYRYGPGDPYRIADRYDFQLFLKSDSHTIHHTIIGTEKDQQIILFDYTRITRTGRYPLHSYAFSALILETPILGRRLILYPRNTVHRETGLDDVHFDHEEFNSAFRVQCEDKGFASAVFHKEMMDFLLSYRALALEWYGHNLLFYSTLGGRFDLTQTEIMRTIALGFHERLPYSLIQTQGHK